MRWAKETANLVNAAAATGALRRIFQWDTARPIERADWLMAIEPGFDRMAALRTVELLGNALADLAGRRDDWTVALKASCARSLGVGGPRVLNTDLRC